MKRPQSQSSGRVVFGPARLEMYPVYKRKRAGSRFAASLVLRNQVVHLLEGTLNLITPDGQQRVLQSGDTLVVFRGQPYRYEIGKSGCSWLQIINPSHATLVQAGWPTVLPRGNVCPLVFQRLKWEMDHPTPLQADLIYHSCQFLSGLIFSEIIRQQGKVRASRGDWVLLAAQAIERSIEQRKSIREMLKELPFSYKQLTRRFYRKFGVSPQAYRSNFRLSKVKDLLANEQLSITYIAHEMGYSSSQHLTADFKKLTGLSPSRWRVERPVVRIRDA